MARNGDVQDERYAVVPWMAKNGDVHDYKDVGGRAKQEARAEDGLSQAPAFQNIRTSCTSTVMILVPDKS